MADDPLDDGAGLGPDPGEKLREKFDRIERDLSSSHSHVDSADHLPSNDEIRAESFNSPIEGALDPENPSHSVEEDPDVLRLRELDRQIADAAAEHRENVSGIQSEFDEQMRALEAKTDLVRGALQKKEAEQQRLTITNAASSRGLGLGLQIAYTIIGLPLVGILVGYFLDRSQGTHLWTGLLAVVGLGGGIALTVMFMNRTNGK